MITGTSCPIVKLVGDDWAITEKKIEVGMKDLVGRCFSLADGHYRIVDIRQFGADAMVYAEPLTRADADSPSAGAQSRGLKRTAFHYNDIAPLLDAASTA